MVAMAIANQLSGQDAVYNTAEMVGHTQGGAFGKFCSDLFDKFADMPSLGQHTECVVGEASLKAVENILNKGAELGV